MVHLGIIPDGNRRYASENNISNNTAYELGFKVLKNLIESIWFQNPEHSVKITELTVYVSSYENLTKRSKKDVENIYNIIKYFISFYHEKQYELIENEVKINIAGDISEKYLPTDISNSLNEIMTNTSHFKQYT